MDKLQILQRLDELRVSVSIRENRIELRPASRVSQALADEIRLNKADLLDYLRWQSHKQEQYEAGLDELQEVERRVQNDGYVLLWSTALEDFLAFHDSTQDLQQIPPGFVPYSIQELWKLFGNGNDYMSATALRRIHAAKRSGANVVDAREDHS